MYRVAICDDEEELLRDLVDSCGRILEEMGVEHELSAFSSALELRKSLEQGAVYDLLCLDILMPGKTGLELAQELRGYDDRTSIVFITGSTEYLLEGYGVRPIQYLLKPLDHGALRRALADDLRLNHTPKTVSVTSGGKTTVMNYSAIRYVESRNHGCAFILDGREEFFWLSMSQAEEILPRDQFCRCHNSYLVNLAHVVKSDIRGVELRGGTLLPISRRFTATFQSALTKYLNSR